MSTLRRRIFGSGDSSQESSRAPSPAPAIRDTNTDSASKRQGANGVTELEEAVKVPLKKLEKLNSYVASRTIKKSKSGRKRRHFWVFGLGGLFGLVMALLFVQHPDVLDLAALKDLNLDSLMDVLPVGLVRDAQALQKHERDAVAYDSFAVGLHAQSEGVTAQHPVIMIPGVISTGLESWGTDADSRQYFRKRLWGSWSMMRALVLDKPSWKRHIMLDKDTGLDPPGVKLRAAQGFDAADFFITGYWIWNKILENLATIGYDPTNAFTAAYDWRLAYGNLEVRDQYFSRLKIHVESSARISNKKVVLLSHSMGGQVLYYFFHWVEASGPGNGNGGPDWVDTFIDSWINISGSMLGALKDLPAVLSGEMKDTAQLNAFAVYGLEKFLARHERAEIFRAMFGLSSMLPIGGEAVWGNQTWAPDDKPGQNFSFGNFVSFREKASNSNKSPASDSIKNASDASNSPITNARENHDPSHDHVQNLTTGTALSYLLRTSEDWYARAIKSNYSFDIAHTSAEVERNQHNPQRWMNPLETRLPLAPSLKIYCFYGVGKDTERAYFYKRDTDPLSRTNVTIDTAYTSLGDRPGEPTVDHGVVLGEGDGTVPLLSMGYMCHRGWKLRRYNPANVTVKVHEMLHEPDRFSPRGGPNTADHVDILGRSSLNDMILRIAGGRGEMVDEKIVSKIREYSDKVQIFEEEGERLDEKGGGKGKGIEKRGWWK